MTLIKKMDITSCNLNDGEQYWPASQYHNTSEWFDLNDLDVYTNDLDLTIYIIYDLDLDQLDIYGSLQYEL